MSPRRSFKAIRTVARLDLAVWRRSPWAIAAAVIPAIAMLVLVKVLTMTVLQQPVALVQEGHGPQATLMAGFLKADKESYDLRVTTRARAARLLDEQQVAAVIVIPKDFDAGVASGRAALSYTLNNVDIDISDDIRRSIDRSVAEFDAPQLGASTEENAAVHGLVVPNAYRVDIAETDLRKTAVPFDTYQTLPVLLLLVISVGVLGGALLGSRDHERRTMTFLRTTPLSRLEFVTGRIFGAVLATLTVLVPTLGYLMFRGTIDPPLGHWVAFLGVLAATVILSSGLGVLLGVAFRRSTTVALAAVILSTYLFFLGGGFTTIAFLPGPLRALSRAVPTRYAIDGMRQALFYPDLHGLGTDLLALTVFAGLALGAGVLALRMETR
jgi:ABC-2 type transport system permease protein